MNKAAIVWTIAGGALAAFAIAAYIYTSHPAVEPIAPINSAIAVDAPASVVAPVDARVVAGAPAVENTTIAKPPPPAASTGTVYVRRHSPVIGPTNAPVTIVEFFDPSCEACRAFHPIVQQIMARHPNEVRLVLRYTPLHQGSDEAVRILETARMQDVFVPVLDALFIQQPQWADHGSPQISLAWDVAASAGLDVKRARAAMLSPRISAALTQDVADARTLNVQGTPTFFVNEKPLTSFGPQQLYNLVLSEIEATK
jgi:protein-disulfide isomerase